MATTQSTQPDDQATGNDRPGVVLVTGAAVRIGREIALGLAAAGWTVAVHYHRSADAAAETVAAIEAAGGQAHAFAADLSREDHVHGLVHHVRETLGPYICLVNNASRFDYDSVGSVSRESWDAHMETNLRAPFVLSQALFTGLPDEADGHIINLLDQRVWNLTPHFVSYSVAKAGLWALTQSLALAMAPRVRVNGIGPGPTLPSSRQSQEQFDAYAARQPLQRAASPMEIRRAVLFILSSPSLTGQMLVLDAGQHLNWAPGKATPLGT